jgi:hypothetical protein
MPLEQRGELRDERNLADRGWGLRRRSAWGKPCASAGKRAPCCVPGGRDEEAADALAAALERYERKGNIPKARHTRTRLVALRVGSSSA